ncbi:hypothetical protein DBV15_11591, partial [Temnothorax longispinosus]
RQPPYLRGPFSFGRRRQSNDNGRAAPGRGRSVGIAFNPRPQAHVASAGPLYRDPSTSWRVTSLPRHSRIVQFLSCLNTPESPEDTVLARSSNLKSQSSSPALEQPKCLAECGSRKENVGRLGGVEEMRVKHPIFESLR